MSDDPIRDALAEVDASDGMDALDQATETAPGEEPDARPEGPLPDDDLDELDGDDETSGFDLYDWATSVPEGTHRDFEARDWWDTEGGAENRVGFHLSDATDGAVGYPNGVGTLVGFAEMYFKHVRAATSDDGGDESAEQDAPDAETVDRNTAEALV